MGVKYYPEIVQGSDSWIDIRKGILTASEMKLILTPTLKMASNDKERTHAYELLAQRITGYVEPHYISDDMLRGQEDEIDARMAYEKNYGPMKQVGFVINDDLGFPIGYSPDGLIGENGIYECKSRCQKYQIETILSGKIPDEHVIQVQTGLFVTKREFCDFTSYCGGLPMITIRVDVDPVVQAAIIQAATEFETRMREKMDKYKAILASEARLVKTERKIRDQEITL